MARRSQCSSAGDNPLDPNYLPPHYREEYRLAIDALVEEDLEGYYQFLQKADVVNFLSSPEIQYIQDFVQVPQQSNHPEQRSLETVGDGSSDTYWPIHSDMDAPGLDLGWPQLHHFIGPTEVTTLVNPPEPEMPSIKEQARRLIKTAQQVVAVAMDMFTDVDIFHDILNAAMRNVAVYILLDEHNAHHFINMVSNCRVNLQSIQFLRVRTVSGITYQCRSGKSLKGQMMDRFLLTDCRAVLSGNYSFMWSFEKLHRCMAHLFLGQLVSTFDEEFRILFAQSQPLIVEDMFSPMEDFNLLQTRQYLTEKAPQYREPKKFLPLDTSHAEEWQRHSYDERLDMNWRMMPLNWRESLHGPGDMYGRLPPQQSRMDPSFDQGPSRIPMMDNPYLKRHSYAEGIHSRYPYSFLPQQGMPELENQGRQFYRQQQPFIVPGKEADCSSHDKFWSQDYLLADQYPEPSAPPEIKPSDNFNFVVNYLSSAGNVDFDQDSDKLPPAADLPFSSSYHRRLSLGQSYACQTSPTPSNPTDQKQFFLEPNTARKDPMVKRGLRDWRISSYLSAYDTKGDEATTLAPPNMPDLYEESSNLVQQTTPVIDVLVPKIPNVREFKVSAAPRSSQMLGHIKLTPQEQPNNPPEEPKAVIAETKTTPTPSDSSSTTEGEKTEEAEQKEPKSSVFHREDPFRRKYNAGVQRSSRLRSSLIFGSLEQQHIPQDTKAIPGQQDEESEKIENEQTKQPFVSQIVVQRRPTAREPFEWSHYMKSATFNNSAANSSKPDDANSKSEEKHSSKEENSKDHSRKSEVQEIIKQSVEEHTNSSPSMSQFKPSEAELTVQPKQPKSLLTTPMYVDMNDANARLMFFKELAAQRKAAKAAQADDSKEKAQKKPPAELKDNSAIKKEELGPKETAECVLDTTSEGLAGKSVIAEKAVKIFTTQGSQDSQVESDQNTIQSSKGATTISTYTNQMMKPKNSQSASNLPVSSEAEALRIKSQEEPKRSSTAIENGQPSHPAATMNAADGNSLLAQDTDKDENLLIDCTSNECSLLIHSLEEVPPSTSAASDSNTQSPESMNLATSISHCLPLSEQHPELEFSSSNQFGERTSLSHSSLFGPTSEEVPPSVFVESDSNTKNPESTILATSISHPPLSSENSELEFSSTSQCIVPDSASQIGPKPLPSCSVLPPTEAESAEVTPEHPDSILSPNEQGTLSSLALPVQEILEKPTASTNQTDHVQTRLDSVSQLTSSKTHAAVELENNSALQSTGETFQVLGSSENVKADSTPPNPNHSSSELRLPDVTDLERKSRSDGNKVIPTFSAADHPSESLAEINTLVHSDLTIHSSKSETITIQESSGQVTPPSELELAGPAMSSSVEIVSCPPLTKSVDLALSHEAEQSLSALISPLDTESIQEQVKTDSNDNTPMTSTETCSPTDATSKVPIEPESVTSKKCLLKAPVPADIGDMNAQNEVSGETEIPDADEKNSDDTEATEVIPTSPQTKQPKPSQSRYLSSTANLLSSSNLRDDTKLLLEQISANSQSRSDTAKETPVTDDEKEDEADKNAKREKEIGMKYLSREQPKSNQEREKVLERIQSMRRERKVYSRFEMAP